MEIIFQNQPYIEARLSLPMPLTQNTNMRGANLSIRTAVLWRLKWGKTYILSRPNTVFGYRRAYDIKDSTAMKLITVPYISVEIY
jgi:hypothetical protein